MNILVTGVAGFIGSYIAKSLLEKGAYVIGVDNINSYYDPSLKLYRLAELKSSNFKFIRQEITDKINIKDDVDLVIHLAAQAGARLPTEHEFKYFDSNIFGFKRVCDFCLQKKTNLIYASSSSVYGSNVDTFYEHEITSPDNLYGLSKKFNEEYAAILTKKSDLKAVGLRFFTAYGPKGRPDMAYYLFAERVLSGKPIQLFNGGLAARDMTYIDDIVGGIQKSVDYLEKMNNSSHEIFNLGNNEPVIINDLLSMIESYFGKKAIKNDISFQEVSNTCANLEKSEKILSYKPTISIEEGLKSFLSWFESYNEKK